MNTDHEDIVRQLDEVEAAYRELVEARPEAFALAVRVEIDASLFQIRRTVAVIDSFYRGTSPSDGGSGWLLVFGVFQAMYVQQDAIIRLARIFRLPQEMILRLTKTSGNEELVSRTSHRNKSR